MALSLDGTTGIDVTGVLTTTGNVGIGTASPSTPLDVLGKGTFSGAGSFQALELITSDTNRVYVTGNSSVSGDMWRIGTSSSNPWLYLDAIQATAGIIFRTSSTTERMRIDSSGNVLVGKTSNGYTTPGIRLAGQGFASNFAHNTSGSTNVLFSAPVSQAQINFYRQDTGAGMGSITNGATNSVSYNTSSDYRLKEDWQPMSGSVDRVKALKPVNFAWKIDGSRVDGFLAHEAQAVVPECVTGEKDAMRDEEYEVTAAIEATYDEEGNELTAAVPAVMETRTAPDYQGIDQSKLVPLLTAALQDSIAKIEALEARVTALENA